MTNNIHDVNSEPPVEEVVQELKTGPVVDINEKGILVFENQNELKAAAVIAMKMPFTPDHLKKEGWPAVAAALLFLKQRNLPQSAMNQCAFVKGKLTQFGSLVTALAEQHPDYGDRMDFFVDEEGDRICSDNKNLKAKVWAAVVRVRKKKSDVWNEYTFSVDDAERANLLTNETKKDSGWIKYCRDMLFHKANSRAMKANYASSLEGVSYHEDLVDRWEPRDVTPVDKADILNKRFASSEAVIN